MRLRHAVASLAALFATQRVVSAPSGFPSSGNGLWYDTPATSWAHEYLPVGNGYLAAMTPGGTIVEATQLNIESLWSGGPFANSSYNGGNKPLSERGEIVEDMASIRKTIFEDALISSTFVYMRESGPHRLRSYAGSGYLVTTIDDAETDISSYWRWLDLDEAIAHVEWTQSGTTYTRETFCPHYFKACIQSTTAAQLPKLTYTFSSALQSDLPTSNVTCLDSSTLMVRGYVAEPGMLYEILGRVFADGSSVFCTSSSGDNATISVATGASSSWIAWVGGTDYSMDAGDAAHRFSFRGDDPHQSLLFALDNLTGTPYETVKQIHFDDVANTLTGPFSLSLGQVPDTTSTTDTLIDEYKTNEGNPYVEWLLFNFGRYLLWSSSRGDLPSNLQGKWAQNTSNAWGADYHSNINIQMNYWQAEMTNLNVTGPLFDYFEKTWAPRGTDTAKVLYNSDRGWVVHDEINIFGHSGMKAGDAQWADYPGLSMVHAWDHFDYTNDVDWWQAQGWPLLKGTAGLHLDRLIEDLYFNDSTLVVNPCNSPEQTYITLGCAHSQQLIWQLFNAVEKGFAASGDNDTAFLEEVIAKRKKMDKGLHIGWWGQLQEWKVDMDNPDDKHRHLSHLVGLYPGYAISSYDSSIQGGVIVNGTYVNYTKEEVLEAAQVSLIHRGNGTWTDANSGWEKAWRAAAWAQLGNASEFYFELSYSIHTNFASNLFSLYYPNSTVFQIDANFGHVGAVLNALIQAPDVHSYDVPLIITLLPALPPQWSSGAISGARIRGGIRLDMGWSDGKLTNATLVVGKSTVNRPVNVVYRQEVVASFTSGSAATIEIEIK
ncbi:glycoside hydrolase family 95 protein [Fistulina hepatica ATCC 64428]|uniref:Glycoside hydrolase family 95 protein n=1 Tax=Fistulina hepatica ATCC 64428 TaxID=1128425 RepID=A0A0D7AK40_9AGAR|nr:glycoside hydrolase family 95 protein [Fistulina hepatica ATCC 64428]